MGTARSAEGEGKHRWIVEDRHHKERAEPVVGRLHRLDYRDQQIMHGTNVTTSGLATLAPQVQFLDLGSGPGRASQESQARCHARIMREAADSDRTAHFLPAQTIDQLYEHLLKGDAMQRITGLGVAHCGQICVVTS